MKDIFKAVKIIIGSQSLLKKDKKTKAKSVFKNSKQTNEKLYYITKQYKNNKELTEIIKIAANLKKNLLSFFSNIEVEIDVTEKKSVTLHIKRVNPELPIWDRVVLSGTSKMGITATFSLEARVTCLKWKDNDVCKNCYAVKGNYLFVNAVGRRKRNLLIIKQDNFVSEMVKLLFNDRHFRWFDSGDISSVTVIKKIIQVCEATPWVQHWIPTNSWDVPKLIPYLRELENLPNVTVRYSSRKYNTPIKWHTSSMVRTKEFTNSELPDGAYLCPSSEQDGECKLCRACWDKNVPIIIYKKH